MKCPDRENSNGFVRPSYSPFHFADEQRCSKHGPSPHLNMSGGCLQCIDDQQQRGSSSAGDDLVFIYSKLLQAESELQDELSSSSSPSAGEWGLSDDLALCDLEFDDWCQSDSDDLAEAIF